MLLGSPEVEVYLIGEGSVDLEGEQIQNKWILLQLTSPNQGANIFPTLFLRFITKHIKRKKEKTTTTKNNSSFAFKSNKLIMYYVSDIYIIYYNCIWKPHLI